jgi:hypothetical protein
VPAGGSVDAAGRRRREESEPSEPSKRAAYGAPLRSTLGVVPGAIAIVVVLLLIPVLVLLSGGVLAAVIGQLLGRDADARHQGSELLELDD